MLRLRLAKKILIKIVQTEKIGERNNLGDGHDQLFSFAVCLDKREETSLPAHRERMTCLLKKTQKGRKRMTSSSEKKGENIFLHDGGEWERRKHIRTCACISDRK